MEDSHLDLSIKKGRAVYVNEYRDFDILRERACERGECEFIPLCHNPRDVL